MNSTPSSLETQDMTAAESRVEALERERTLDTFRRWGYLQAAIDPLGRMRPLPHAELDAIGEEGRLGRKWYCGAIGADFMHITDPERRRWIQAALETAPPPVPAEAVLDRVITAELFEEILHARYPGTKRFSLEGAAALIPLLDAMLDSAGSHGATELMLGMSHRGRLNVMTHIVGISARDVFTGFEDVQPRKVLGCGDVKYHQGATGTYRTLQGHSLLVRLVSNPSHLEAVYPVVLGRTRARQVRLGDQEQTAVVPVVLHGDAAFTGQGVVAETLNLADIDGFSVGGTLHIIVNNLIGFTTNPGELHSSPFAADAAKRQPIPVFHVNGEDLAAVVRVGYLAQEYRRRFKSDVVVDLIGYRRHGHSEVDDPTVTQPGLYAAIKARQPLWKNYAASLGIDADERARAIRTGLQQAQGEAAASRERPTLSMEAEYWSRYRGGCYRAEYDVDTGVPVPQLQEIGQRLTTWPEDFHVHPKTQRLLQHRAEMLSGKRAVDFGMAETLAFGSLLHQGVSVRLTGQDSRRGTFNQRHAVLTDIQTGQPYLPLAQVASSGARFDVHNSTLSEAGVLGYEYGYSRDYPEALVLWEAQFGDFANNAQVVIDQFVASAEDKWRALSGLVMLLPHGYEGQGPEHSSARIERFLQLAAEDNLQICQPSTAVQYFHLLRRHALSVWRTPLIVFTPKSMLRQAASSSAIDEFATPRFQRVFADTEAREARRILVCTGKIGHELRHERARRNDMSVAIVSLEQMYPFPAAELTAAFAQHPTAREIVWVQEEPANMGARAFVIPRLRRLAGGRPLRSVRRSASGSPATGSGKAHEIEQKTVLQIALG